MTLVTAFKTLLFRYTEQDDVIIGTIVAGQSRAEIERVMGFFVNTLVLRTDLSGNPTFREVLLRTRAVVLDAQSHSDFPYEKLVEELRPERNLSRSPFFEVVFNMMGYRFGAELSLPGLKVVPFPHLSITRLRRD